MSKKTPKTAKSDLASNFPTVLSFRRAIECSDATMYGLAANGVQLPLNTYLHGQRPTKSFVAKKKAGDTQGVGKDNEANHLICGERAKLPAGAEALGVAFAYKVFPIHSEPDSCDNPAWYHAIMAKLQDAKAGNTALRHIAHCYAYSTAVGASLWRNRDVADDLAVTITYTRPGEDEQSFTINDVLDRSSRPVATPSEKAAGVPDPYLALAESKDFAAFAAEFEASLRGEKRPLRVNVAYRVALGPNEDVWPSQLFIPGGRTAEGTKMAIGRNLFRVGGREDGPVGITAEKLTNAMRTFDNAHGDKTFPNQIIPMEPNGGSLQLGRNLRDKNTLYALLPEWLEGTVPLSFDDEVFLLACFVRGGVFSGKSRKPGTPAETANEGATATAAAANEEAAA